MIDRTSMLAAVNHRLPPLPRLTLLCLLAGLGWGGVTHFAQQPGASSKVGPVPRAVSQVVAATATAEPGRRTRQSAAKTSARRVSVDFDSSSKASADRVARDVTYLASDELEGRGVRTRGIEKASDHIAEEFRKAGLKLDHYRGTPFQEFRLGAISRKGMTQELSLTVADGKTQTLVPGSDFASLMVSPRGAFSLPVVFVGYGITAPKLGYDDYAGIDARGKAVIVLRHEPQRRDPRSLFNGLDESEHAYLWTKIQNAVAHGAAAMLICTDRADLEPAPPAKDQGAATPGQGAAGALPGVTPEKLLQFEFDDEDVAQGIPVIHCRRSVIKGVFQNSTGGDLDLVEAGIDSTLHPASRDLPAAKVSGKVELTRRGLLARNVVASLETTGPHAEETIVVGAHYDHLGRGGWGSLAPGSRNEIHNGADDNASGTSVLLEVARRLAARPKPLGRRVLFIAFSAEELGLIGSARYVQQPLVPLGQTVAMLNLDMVGRLRNDKLFIYGTGTATEWPALLAAPVTAQKLNVVMRPSGDGPSDHASFHEKGIPVLHFFTGFHPEYHRPSDDSNLINADGMQRIASLVTEIVVELADRLDRLHPTSDGETLDLGDLNIAGLIRRLPALAAPPRFGMVTEPLPEGGRLVVRRFLPGSAAQRSGMRVGDVITKVDHKEVRNATDLRTFIDARRAGDEIPVEISRQGTAIEIVVRLGS